MSASGKVIETHRNPRDLPWKGPSCRLVNFLWHYIINFNADLALLAIQKARDAADPLVTQVG